MAKRIVYLVLQTLLCVSGALAAPTDEAMPAETHPDVPVCSVALAQGRYQYDIIYIARGGHG